MLGEHEKILGEWCTSFSRVLPTSQVGYHASNPIDSVVYCFYKNLLVERNLLGKKCGFSTVIKSCLLSKVIISQAQQKAALQNTSFCNHYMITYESCFTGKVSSFSCERTVKEYVHALFTTDVENWTSGCSSCILLSRSGTGSNGGLHSLWQAVVHGLRSVCWTLSWIRNAAVTTWLHLRSCRM